MTSSRKTIRRGQSGLATAVIVAVSLAAHGAIAVSAEFSFGSSGTLPTLALVEAEEVEYQFSCSADANLALLARNTMCVLPGSQSSCRAKVWEDYQFDLILCEGLKDSDTIKSEEFAFLTPDEIDQIQPESLLDVQPMDELEAAKLLEEKIEEKAEAALEKISNPKMAGQVIEVTEPQLEVVPDRARFLSEYNTKVETETVARGSTEDMVSKPAPKELPVIDEPPPLPEAPIPSGELKPQLAMLDSKPTKATADVGRGKRPNVSPLLAMRAAESRQETVAGEQKGSDALESNGLAAKLGDAESSQKGQRAQEGREAVSAGAGAARSLPNLRPTKDMLARAIGGGSVDKLDGVESGENTALNSKKWKFASFFNRMKRQVAQNWHPAGVYMRRDPTGNVYGTKNRETVLEVFLKPDGNLDHVIVLKGSGVDFLDDEAAAAFERAAPFPNPPTGLIDSGTGHIRFSFGFHFQVGSRRDSWKVFRYK